MGGESSLSLPRTFGVVAFALSTALAGAATWLPAAVADTMLSAASTRIGAARFVVSAPHVLSEALLQRLQHSHDAGPSFRDAAPVIAVDGVVARADGGSHIPRVIVYGVDARFWRLNDIVGIDGPARDLAWVSASMLTTLGVQDGAAIDVTIQRVDDVPFESVHGLKANAHRTLRLRVSSALAPGAAALNPLLSPAAPDSAPVMFVNLSQLQEGAAEGWINHLLLPDVEGQSLTDIEQALAREMIPQDYGLALREDEVINAITVEARGGLLDETMLQTVSAAALDVGALPTPVLTTLVHAIRLGARHVPYSFVASIELQAIAPDVHAEELSKPPIIVNDWTAQQLGARRGDILTLEFPTWRAPGRLITETAEFEVAGTVPLAGPARQPTLTPKLPGITGARTMREWMPRIPVDSSRIRPADETYWTEHGPTPKAFVPPQVARALWRTGVGSATSVQIAPADGATLRDTLSQLERRLRDRLAPAYVGVTVRDSSSDARHMAQDAKADLVGIVGWSAPLVLAGLMWTIIASVAGGLDRRRAMSFAATGTLAGLICLPVVMVTLKAVWSWTVPSPSHLPSPGLQLSIASSAIPIIVTITAGGVGALLLSFGRPFVTRRAAIRGSGTLLAAAIGASIWLIWAGRTGDSAAPGDRHSTSGGYALFVRTTLPLPFDPGGPASLDGLGLTGQPDVHVTPFRVHDAGAHVLQSPVGPVGVRIVAVSQQLLDEGRFTFAAALDRSDEERANPWLLLRREQRDRSDPAGDPPSPVVPTITSERMLARLGWSLGGDLTITPLGRPVRLRAVATIRDAFLDNAVLMLERDFETWFPSASGLYWLAIEGPQSGVASIREGMSTALLKRGATFEDGAHAARDHRLAIRRREQLRFALLGGAVLVAFMSLATARSRYRL